MFSRTHEEKNNVNRYAIFLIQMLLWRPLGNANNSRILFFDYEPHAYIDSVVKS